MDPPLHERPLDAAAAGRRGTRGEDPRPAPGSGRALRLRGRPLYRKDGELAADIRNGNDQAWRGRYAEQLARLYEHFPREQVLVQQYERCTAEPESELARSYRFLGLDANFLPDSLHDRLNAAVRRWALSDHMARELRRYYAPDLARLPELVPGIDLGLWPTARG